MPAVDGRALDPVQLPTTLPTLDELIGTDGIEAADVARAVLALTDRADTDQVFTLHAELEGGLLAPAFEALLAGWRAPGHAPVPLGALHRGLVGQRLPRFELAWGRVPGRSGELIVAG